MTRPRQETTIERLEKMTIAAIRDVESMGERTLDRMWSTARKTMKDDIAEEYRRDFSGSTWNILMAARHGTLKRIDMRIAHRLNSFREASIKVVQMTLREIYRVGVLRNVWILDQVTPQHIVINLPKSPVLTEADRDLYRGPDADTAWKVRWSAWLDAYQGSLNQNLKLGSMNESTMSDAEQEVDASRAGTPAIGLFSALARVFTSQAQSTYVMAQNDVREANDDLDIEEIWQTRYYERVCDDCDANAGLSRDEAEGDIPLHPNCGCYWRMVPKSWAALLKSGSDADFDLAKKMDAEGVVPSAMVVRNDDGDIVGASIVSFTDWIRGKARVISVQ